VSDGEPLVRFDWAANHLGDIWQRLVEHVVSTLLAVAIGFAISCLLALLVRRRRWLYGPVTWVGGVLYTIPSLGLFALLIPVTGLSLLTAEIGLVSYTLLVLTRSIVSALDSTPPEVRETAIGLGCTPWQLLWRVEWPLGLPIVIAGVRVATISTIGLVTVTALIGQGGLGAFVLEGLQRFFTTPLIVGAVLSVALGMLADIALVGVERWATPWARGRGVG